MSYNTKIYDSTNNNYNANFDTYIMGNNNIPVDGNLYYNNKFAKVMTSFIVDSGDSILGGNVLVSENLTIHGKSDFKNDVTIRPFLIVPETRNIFFRYSVMIFRIFRDGHISCHSTLSFWDTKYNRMYHTVQSS